MTVLNPIDSQQSHPEQIPTPASLQNALSVPSPPKRQKIALLYKRNAQPDDHVLNLLEAGLLGQGHDIFLDRHLPIGVAWAQEIERQVRSADAVIPILSQAAVHSEMLDFEIRTAHEAAQAGGGKPRILPIRVRYTDSLPDSMEAILKPIQYTLWESE